MARRVNAILLGACLAAGSLFISGIDARAQPRPARIVIQYPATASIGGVLPWIAKEKGLFSRNGLEAELVFATASTAMQALVAGSIDMAGGDVLAALSAFAGGADVVVIGSFANSTPYVMATRPKVQRIAELKGGKIGIQSLTGRGTVFTRFVLEEAGIDPDRDVQLLRVGGTEARVGALAAGHIDGALVNPGVSDQIRKAGLNVINLRGVSFIDAEFHVMRDRLEERRAVLVRAFAAIRDAAALMKNDRKGSVEVIQKLMKVDRQAGESAYDVWAQYVVTNPQIPAKIVQETLKLAERVDPRLKQIDTKKFFHTELAGSLPEFGK